MKLFVNFALTLLFFVFVGCVQTPVTGKRAFIVTSEQEEAQLGAQAYRETLQKSRVANHPKWNAMLQRVGNRIANAASKPEYKWQFTLVESNEKNAFCLPGGKVAFYTGIVSSFQNEAQMAAVMGHEVAHATARHGGQRMTVQFGTQLGFSALDAFMGGTDTVEKKMLFQAIGLGATVGAILPFSRGHESEADRIGLVYMASAGYDPNAAALFWESFGKDNAGPPQWLSTHPSSGNRAEAIRGWVPEAMKYYQSSPKYGLGERP